MHRLSTCGFDFVHSLLALKKKKAVKGHHLEGSCMPIFQRGMCTVNRIVSCYRFCPSRCL